MRLTPTQKQQLADKYGVSMQAINNVLSDAWQMAEDLRLEEAAYRNLWALGQRYYADDPASAKYTAVRAVVDDLYNFRSDAGWPTPASMEDSQ